jgi:hypothetical protein
VEPSRTSANAGATELDGRDKTFTLPAEEFNLVTLREPEKKVPGKTRRNPPRQLSLEDKRRRRFRRNVIMWFVGVAVLLGTAALLSRL